MASLLKSRRPLSPRTEPCSSTCPQKPPEAGVRGVAGWLYHFLAAVKLISGELAQSADHVRRGAVLPGGVDVDVLVRRELQAVQVAQEVFRALPSSKAAHGSSLPDRV